MNVHIQSGKTSGPGLRDGVIDCDIHPLMRHPTDIEPYLDDRWREHHRIYGGHVRQPFAGTDLYSKVAPHISRRDAYPPTGGPPGSDLDFMREQHIEPHKVALGVLQLLQPKAGDQRNLEYGAAIASAVNDWQIAEWTSKEPRLKGSIVINQDHPDAAVAEIVRHRGKDDFVQISVPQRTVEPAGRRRYWPIYAAASDSDLTIGIHTGGNNGYPPVAGGGWCSYYAEQHHLVSVGMQAVVASLVMEGVFEEFPSLRVVLIEGGFTWVPALMWRLDNVWSRQRAEVPHVKRPPSEYIREHCWFSTQPMEEVDNHDYLRDVFEWTGWDRLVFSSDYPHWDYDDTRYVFPFPLSEEEKRKIFRDNAMKAYNIA